MGRNIKTNIIHFLNERFDVNTMPKDIVLLSDIPKGLFLLYDVKIKKPIGYIAFSFYDKINSYTVNGAYSKNGYGAFLYESAMTHVYPNGLSMSRDGGTSFDALEVWFKFLKRKDVANERIFSDEITHKKEDWLGSGFLNDNIKLRESIFDLEDTRFFYNYGKEKLNKMIDQGKIYMSHNNISEEDIKVMSWDLE